MSDRGDARDGPSRRSVLAVLGVVGPLVVDALEDEQPVDPPGDDVSRRRLVARGLERRDHRVAHAVGVATDDGERRGDGAVADAGEATVQVVRGPVVSQHVAEQCRTQ